MPLVTVLQGLPASGKSTWARKQCEENNFTKRINKDDLRGMLGGNHSKGFENVVKHIRDHALIECMNVGYDIIVDDTNFHPSHILRINEIAKDYGRNYTVEILEFVTPFEVCVERDSRRIGTECVGYRVIANMAKMRTEYAAHEYPNIKSTITF